jgi:hypothetical protein
MLGVPFDWTVLQLKGLVSIASCCMLFLTPRTELMLPCVAKYQATFVQDLPQGPLQVANIDSCKYIHKLASYRFACRYACALTQWSCKARFLP